MAEKDGIVVDSSAARWSDLWKKEDYWAIWLGFALLLFSICIYINGAPAEWSQTIAQSNAIMKEESAKAPFKTIAYFKAQDAKAKIKGTNLPISKDIAWLLATPSKWSGGDLFNAFYVSQASADAKNAVAREKAQAAQAKAAEAFTSAQAAEAQAAEAQYKDPLLNQNAEKAIGEWRKAQSAAQKAAPAAKSKNVFVSLITLLICMGVFFGIGAYVMGWNVPKFLIGFAGVFIVAVIAMTLGNQKTMAYYGLGVEPWAIIIGMLIANKSEAKRS